MAPIDTYKPYAAQDISTIDQTARRQSDDGEIRLLVPLKTHPQCHLEAGEVLICYERLDRRIPTDEPLAVVWDELGFVGYIEPVSTSRFKVSLDGESIAFAFDELDSNQVELWRFRKCVSLI